MIFADHFETAPFVMLIYMANTGMVFDGDGGKYDIMDISDAVVSMVEYL